MRVLDHPLHLGVDILQPLNGVEKLGDGRQAVPARGEKVQHNKGKCAEVTKCLILGRDGGKAGPRGHP